MKNIESIAFFIFFTAISYKGLAQTTSQKIGTNPTTISPSALLELESPNKGILMPRVALTSTTDITTIVTPANALTVFNTATAGATPDNVLPGYYYYSTIDAKWVRLLTGQSLGWNITGNAGTDASTNFLGTTDEQSLVFKVNGIQAGLLEGAVGIASHRRNTSFGVTALNPANTGNGNTATGFQSMNKNTTGEWNVANGYWALVDNISGNTNTAIGSEAMIANTIGSDNVAVGYAALYQSTGNGNIGIGHHSGWALTEGDNNIFIGNAISPNVSYTGSNQLNINNWIYGDNGKIGLGTAIVPTNLLHINGGPNPVRFEGLQAGAATDKVVVADADGVLKTVAASNFTGPIITVTSSYILTINDYTVIFTGGASAPTFTLPDPTTCKGRMYHLVNGSSTASYQDITLNLPVTLYNGNTSSLVSIDTYSSSSVTSPVIGNTALIQSDGTKWWRIGL